MINIFQKHKSIAFVNKEEIYIVKYINKLRGIDVENLIKIKIDKEEENTNLAKELNLSNLDLVLDVSLFILRRMDVTSVPSKSLRDFLMWEIAFIYNLDPKEFVFDFEIIKYNNLKKEAQVYLIPKKVLKGIFDFFTKMGTDINSIKIESEILEKPVQKEGRYNFCFYPKEKILLVLFLIESKVIYFKNLSRSNLNEFLLVYREMQLSYGFLESNKILFLKDSDLYYFLDSHFTSVELFDEGFLDNYLESKIEGFDRNFLSILNFLKGRSKIEFSTSRVQKYI